ncbi:GGDEF domain-containing phosphodiesterase [Cobetia sp. MB87]|uniref:EAL domain-containing protein n=1 Tax=Cobetia sp. MB87 TaxID=2588451 RepID=UPI00140E68F6|nr:Phytochrome-like protein cph2 [Cobetia sp. MB87]
MPLDILIKLLSSIEEPLWIHDRFGQLAWTSPRARQEDRVPELPSPLPKQPEPCGISGQPGFWLMGITGELGEWLLVQKANLPWRMAIFDAECLVANTCGWQELFGTERPRLEPVSERRVRLKAPFSGLAEARAAGVDDKVLIALRRLQPINLLSRDRFNAQIDELLLEESVDGSIDAGIIYLSLTHLEIINSAHGAERIDPLLERVAEAMSLQYRDALVCRPLGNAFALFFVGDEASLIARANELCERLVMLMRLDGKALPVTARVGISLAPQHARRAHRLMHLAELAMLHGEYDDIDVCGPLHVFSPGAHMQHLNDYRLTSDLREHLEELDLAFQPQFDLASGQAVGVEVLVRWDHPELGTIGPGRFIPLAEQYGLIGTVGARVMDTALSATRDLVTPNGKPLSVAINVSAQEFRDPGFPERVSEALARHDFAPERLELEITESSRVPDLDRVVERLTGLIERGVRLAIDDFGTGFASLLYVRDLRACRLKVDQRFVGSLDHDARDRAIVSHAISLADSLGMEVLAEGVETAEQERLLVEMGCHLVQGFRYARPKRLPELVEWLKRKPSIHPCP